MCEKTWFEVTRTDAGRRQFSRQFRYCRKFAADRCLVSDGGLAWFVCSTEGMKKYFTLGDKCDEEISKSIEETYQRTKFNDGKELRETNE